LLFSRQYPSVLFTGAKFSIDSEKLGFKEVVWYSTLCCAVHRKTPSFKGCWCRILNFAEYEICDRIVMEEKKRHFSTFKVFAQQKKELQLAFNCNHNLDEITEYWRSVFYL